MLCGSVPCFKLIIGLILIRCLLHIHTHTHTRTHTHAHTTGYLPKKPPSSLSFNLGFINYSQAKKCVNFKCFPWKYALNRVFVNGASVFDDFRIQSRCFHLFTNEPVYLRKDPDMFWAERSCPNVFETVAAGVKENSAGWSSPEQLQVITTLILMRRAALAVHFWNTLRFFCWTQCCRARTDAESAVSPHERICEIHIWHLSLSGLTADREEVQRWRPATWLPVHLHSLNCWPLNNEPSSPPGRPAAPNTLLLFPSPPLAVLRGVQGAWAAYCTAPFTHWSVASRYIISLFFFF